MEQTVVTISVEVKQGDAGMFYATSPLIKGLLAVGATKAAALEDLQRCISNLDAMAANEHLDF